MALPNSTDLQTMDYSFNGQPFVNVPAKSGIDTTTMDYSFQAQPFVTNPYPTVVTVNSNFFLFF